MDKIYILSSWQRTETPPEALTSGGAATPRDSHRARPPNSLSVALSSWAAKGPPMNILPREKQIQIVAALTEGCSIRATERLTDTHRDSVMRLGVRVGQGCRRLVDGMLRNLQVNLIELDEQWAFIGKKQKRVKPEERMTALGDCYVFVALDATSKAVLSYVIGKRDATNTVALAKDLRARIVNRPQITADGFAPYPGAIEEAFGADVDFATLIKTYAVTPGNQAAVRYSPGTITSIEKKVIAGDPDMGAVSTSLIERFNLTTRMQSRRFTRLTSGYSKKFENHAAAIALQFAFYNVCRWHETIRATPGMALRVTDHVWSIGELVDAALSAPEPEPLVTDPQGSLAFTSAAKAKGQTSPTTPRKLYVIKGGKRGRR
jgi:IS1 family transposase